MNIGKDTEIIAKYKIKPAISLEIVVFIICSLLSLMVYLFRTKGDIADSNLSQIGLLVLLFIFFLTILILVNSISQNRFIGFSNEGVFISGGIFRPSGFLLYRWSDLSKGFKINKQTMIFLTPRFSEWDYAVNLGDNIFQATKVVSQFIKQVE